MRDSIKVVSELYQVFLTSLLLLVITHNLIKRKITFVKPRFSADWKKYSAKVLKIKKRGANYGFGLIFKFED